MYEKLKNEVLAKLTEKRLIHTEGVRKTAARMCEIYGEDREKVDLAVCFHDLYGGKQAEELDRLIDKYGIPGRYKGNANLAHGKLAAAAMEQDYGITDEEVLSAVSFHTTGRADMSTMEKIVFLSDATEPGRDYPGVDALREMAEESLDRACLMSLEGTIKFLEEQGVANIDSDTIEARDYLLERLNSKQ